LVAPALDAETVDIVAAEEDGEVASDLAQIDALGAQLVTVEDDLGLGLIELEVRVGKDEQPARKRLLHQLAGNVAEPLRLRRRRDDEVHRKIAASGEWRWRRRNRTNPRNRREGSHRFHQQLLRRLRSLAPGPGDHSAEAAGRLRQLEYARGLGKRA